MGYGSWDSTAYTTYAKSRGYATNSSTYVGSDGETYTVNNLSPGYSAQDLFKERRIHEKLNPYKVMRECNDSDEHPNTVPVVLALDVTGSMGSAAAEVAKKLNEVMSKLYERVTDVEFMVMAIGDLAYDSAPIQISQFEADIRVAEWLDKVYFERGGGGNTFESYTAAWYMGVNHMMLDSWKRGKKGIIITIGDEPLNPYLPRDPLAHVTGDNIQADIKTKDLYLEAVDKFDIYHLAVDDPATCYMRYVPDINKSFGEYLDSDHLRVVKLNDICDTIVDIVENAVKSNSDEMRPSFITFENEISW